MTLIAIIITQALQLIWPSAPAWAIKTAVAVVPVLIDTIDELEEASELEGAAKFGLAMELTRRALDDSFDDVPEWSALGEGRRDLIVGGLVELALFLHRLAEKEGKPSTRKRVRSAVRGVRRA